MSKQEIAESVSKYVWFDKESRVGNWDKISGQVVHPLLRDDFEENEEEQVGQHVTGMTQIDDTKELKIDGCSYETSKLEIRKWIETYGVIKSEI